MDDFKLISPGDRGVSQEVRQLLTAVFSDNTKRAYRSDLQSFLRWGGHIPSSTEEITRYIAESCPRLSIITLRRRVSALVSIHMALDMSENPAQHPLVSKTLKGAARTHGAAQRAVKPLLIEDLRRILDLEGNTIVDHRNKALLTIGFAGGFRRSELVALNRHDIEERPEGLVINIAKSKTDQEKVGRTIGIPFGRGQHCPVRLLLDWMHLCGPIQDPVFRGCAKGGRITDKRLSSEAVAKVVKASVSRIGLNPVKYSGHSLRAGFVTSAVAAGARTDLIRKQTGHASDQTMARYIRDGDMFRQNAASLLF